MTGIKCSGVPPAGLSASVSTPSGCVRRGTGDSAETLARTHSKSAPKHINRGRFSSAIARLQMALPRYLLRPGYSGYPAAIRGDLMRCADPERIATLVADHRDFVSCFRASACAARERPNPSALVLAGKSYRFRWLGPLGHGRRPRSRSS